jgi:hypothetical protein
MFVVDNPTHPFALTGLGCWTGQWGLFFFLASGLHELISGVSYRTHSIPFQIAPIGIGSMGVFFVGI